MITLTPHAGHAVKTIVQQQRFPDGTALRLGVTDAGCEDNGTKFRYQMDFDAKPATPQDEVFESAGMKIYVDRQSLPHLDGLQLDVQQGEDGVQFMFHNPRARRSCGCGHTFSDEDE